MKPFASSLMLFIGSTLMVAAAQQPAPSPIPASAPAAPVVTTHSSIRGFSASPDGTPRTLFLYNGDAVELGPRFGSLPSGEMHKGQRVEVTGTSTQAERQRTIDALTLRVGAQTYTATAALNVGPDGGPPVAGPPPPPAGAPGAPAPPAQRDRRGPPVPPPCAAPPLPPVGAPTPVPPPSPADGTPPPPTNGAVATPPPSAPQP